MQSRLRFYLKKFSRILFRSGHLNNQVTEEDEFIALTKANKEQYRREFRDDITGTYRLAEHRLQGQLHCEHTITSYFVYTDIASERNLCALRQAATLVKYSKCHCIDLELIHSLNESDLYFTFEDLEIWKNLLAEGRLEEAVYLEYGIAALHETSHPNQVASGSHPSTPSSQNESSTQYHPHQQEAFIEALPGSPEQDVAEAYVQNLQRGRSLHRQQAASEEEVLPVWNKTLRR